MESFVATLNDWPDLRKFYDDFTRSPYRERFDLDFDGFERYFKLSLVNPKYALICVREAGELVGVTVVYENYAHNIHLGLVPQTFIHVCHIKPSASRAVGERMNQAIETWGRFHGHNYITANVRVNAKNPFKLRAIDKRYGFKPQYLVIGRPIEGGA